MHVGPGWRRATVAALAALAAAPCAASANTLVVKTTSDGITSGAGTCSLREAIASVDTPATPNPNCAAPSADGNTIMLGAGRYVLTIAPTGVDDNTTGDLDIEATVANLTIQGAGAASTTIDASGLGDRALMIDPGASVTITGLTITGGHAPAGANQSTFGQPGGPGADGGGIFNFGTLTLNDAGVTASFAGSGGTGGLQGTGGAGGVGGGIDNLGTLTLDSSTISSNHAGAGGTGGSSNGESPGAGGSGGQGGGIYNGGTLTIGSGSALSGDVAGAGGAGGSPIGGFDGAAGGAGGGGGGIYNDDDGQLTLTGATLGPNTAGAGGAGSFGNGAFTGTGGAGGAGGCGGAGGGLDTVSSLPVTITASTLSGNAAGAGGAAGGGGAGGGPGGVGGSGCAGASGGGIESSGATLTIVNSTLTGNFAGAGGAGGAGGFGIESSGGTGGTGGAGGDGGAVRDDDPSGSTLSSDTVSENGVGGGGSAGAAGDAEGPGSTNGSSGTPGVAGAGGGIYSPSVTCVVGQPCETGLEDTIFASNAGANCGGRVSDDGNNLSFGDTSCPGINGDPMLGPLQDNGGPTQTIDLGAGSAAIGAVPVADCPATDQRGLPRPPGQPCDIGAYEVTPPAASTGPASAIGSSSATVAATVTANTAQATVVFELGTTTSYGMQKTATPATGLMPAPITATFAGLRPSTTYHYRVQATSSDGAVTGADRTFTTTAAPPTAPKLSRLALNPARFAAARSGPAIGSGRGPGTKVSYDDTEAASTSFSVLRLEPGVRSGPRCVAPPRRRGGHRRACTRLRPAGKFVHVDLAGSNRFRFTGRVGGHRLVPGRYELVAVPRAHRLRGKAVTVSFRVAG